MRLGVLDVGSNTVHLLVVDAHRGAHPWPAHSEKSVLRLAEELGPGGEVSPASAAALVTAVAEARQSARRLGVDDFLAFATSALREASNGVEVLDRVRDETGVRLSVLSGEDEARITFLAVRRWFGWSAGRLLVVDIGGGSLELAAGLDEEPDLAISLPLGAGRLTRAYLGDGDPPSAGAVAALEAHVAGALEPAAAKLTDVVWERAVATSKTLRSLARLAGAAPSSAGHRVPRQLTGTGLRQVMGFIRHIPAPALAGMDGVSGRRAHQLLAGAVVAAQVMRRLELPALQQCPWALREGMILRRLDILDPA
ncbi:Ppx/GppA family phosphatase [Natronosporangium hydrolyticum]|uniref:Ppx/GppA family phosphatase n=1 Tax=Natronosporangium hydrolyticum TaxID=2811111 RepID=A0A895YE94_9ACTN|nr:Ppx/GppA phosphatase family protein [Natronosporangium hydrolyticum]QSB14485.1 Ppx/GppA family phosphatase [Natronosporangium hydrolyticum]